MSFKTITLQLKKPEARVQIAWFQAYDVLEEKETDLRG